MKKGSKSRKCSDCGRIIFWMVPDSSVLGMQFCTTKSVRKWRYVRMKSSRRGEYIGRYLCLDCLNKTDPEKILPL